MLDKDRGIIRPRSNCMSMEKPGQVYPAPAQAPTSVASPMPIWIPDPSLRGQSFDQLLTQRGIRVMHERSVPCPNIITPDTNAHQPECTFCDESGILHYGSKEIYGVFTGNSIEKTFEAHGIWEVGSAVMTFPVEYADGIQADFNTYDRLTFPDFTVRMWELKEYEPRPGKLQTMRYPVHNVDFVSSITGGVQRMYNVGVDFNITPTGDIEWIAGMEPAYDSAALRGDTVVWSYYANPVYVVVQSLRELRITQELVNGQKVSKRLPQQVLVKRDFLIGAGEKIVTP
jgi:hypothetical protein